MKLLQLKIDEKLKNAIEKKSEIYGVPASSLIRIVLVKTFLEEQKNVFTTGNIFNASRDSNGKGIPIDDIIAAL